MLDLLNERKENNTIIREYTRNGETVSHTISFPVGSATSAEESIPQLTLEDKVNYIYYKNMGVIE